MRKNKLTVISTYMFSHEAHIAKASLENEGVAAYIADENIVQMNWLYNNLLGGVKLLVAERDVEQAKRILMTDYSDNIQQEGEEFEVKEPPARCTTCGSNKVEPFTKGKTSVFLSILFLGFPHFFYKRGFKCMACGRFYKDKPV